MCKIINYEEAMPKLITATDLVRSFSDIVGRVYYKRETFDIKKGANIVARLSPVKIAFTVSIKDLNKFFHNVPHLDQGDIKEFTKTVSDLKSLKNTRELNKWD